MAELHPSGLPIDQGAGARPMVSVHCITYNHGPYIAKALESFLEQQTTFAVEIVVGEDCSTDDTRSVVADYIRRYPDRIRLIASEDNVGPAANYERTLRACRGKYVAICEGDDYWRDATKLAQQVRFLEENQDYVLCYHDAVAFDENGFEAEPQLPARLQCDASQLELIRTRPISTLTACFRNVVHDIPPELRPSPILDLCLWSLLGHHGRGKYLRGIQPAAYRKHAQGLMSLKSKQFRLRATGYAYVCLSRYYGRIAMPAHSDYFTRAALVAFGGSLSAWNVVKSVSALVGSMGARPLHALRALMSRR